MECISHVGPIYSNKYVTKKGTEMFLAHVADTIFDCATGGTPLVCGWNGCVMSWTAMQVTYRCELHISEPVFRSLSRLAPLVTEPGNGKLVIAV
jgi:hypothetical protein